MKYDKKTMKALDKSIEHWERVVKGEDIRIGADACALCGLFNLEDRDRDDHREDCVGCPVFDKTEFLYCVSTPQDRLVDAIREESERDFDVENKKQLALAKAELKFLKSIREEIKVKKK